MVKISNRFFDVTQTEYWFSHLFKTEAQLSIVRESGKQFVLKAPLFLFIVALFRFFIWEQFPSLVGIVVLLIFFYVTVFLLFKYVKIVNKLTESMGLLGMILLLLPLFVIVLLIP